MACRLTPIEGLLKYKLERPTYDCTLGGIAPFYEIWVSLRVAREIAKDLGVFDLLSGLLEWETRKAWSVEDREQGGMVHNWKISSDRILPQDYSTQQMLSVSFPQMHLLPAGSQVRTLLPPMTTFETFVSSSPSPTSPPAREQAIATSPSVTKDFESLWIKLTEWSVHEYENWLEVQDSPVRSPPSEGPNNSNVVDKETTTRITTPIELDDLTTRSVGSSLTPLFLFSTLSPLLSLTNQIPPSPSTPVNLNRLSHLRDVVLSRSELLPPSTTVSNRDGSDETNPAHVDPSSRTYGKGVLYLIDTITRLTLDAYERTGHSTELNLRPSHGTGKSSGRERDQEQKEEEERDWRNCFEERLSTFEARLATLSPDVVGQNASSSHLVQEEEEDIEDLRRRIRKLERLLHLVDEEPSTDVLDSSRQGHDYDTRSRPDGLVRRRQQQGSQRMSRDYALGSIMERIGEWTIGLLLAFGLTTLYKSVVA